MKKLVSWLKESHRLAHIGGGVLIGILSDDNYCAALAGIGIASALELKDKLWGGKFDIIDWSLTVCGVFVGRLIRIVI